MSETRTETAAHADPRPAMARAQDAVDHAGERVGQVAARLGHRLRVMAVRTREEAEDIWAEAQSMRRADEHS